MEPVAVALEQAADDVDAEATALRCQRLGRRPGDLLGEPHRLGGAVEHVARDRALGQDEQLRTGRRRPPRVARDTLPGCARPLRASARSAPPRRATSVDSTTLRLASMTTVRFYYDVVCPYSYMESHAVEAAEDAGAGRGRMAPVRAASGAEARCSSRAATICASTGRRTSTGARSRSASRSTCPATSRARRCRSPPASGPASSGRLRPFKHALYEAFFCEGEDIATDAQIARAAAARGARPGRRGRGGLLARSDTRRSPRSAREAEAAACGGVPSLLDRDGESHWGWAGSSACCRRAADRARLSAQAVRRRRPRSAELQDVERRHVGLEPDLPHQLDAARHRRLGEVAVERLAILPDGDEPPSAVRRDSSDGGDRRRPGGSAAPRPSAARARSA